jgi:hypothetical protein
MITNMAKTLAALLLTATFVTAQTTPVSQFGAFPDDGATNATQGIQAAINAAKGSRVYLPKDTPGSGAEAMVSIENGAITGLRVTNQGTHYCKPPEIIPNGANGQGARLTGRVDAACHLVSIDIDQPGSGYTSPPAIFIVPRLRCYKVGQIILLTGTMLEGEGEASCIVPDGSNQPVISSQGAYRFRLRNFSLISDGKTDIGMQFNGGLLPGERQFDGSPASDALLSTIEAVSVSGFRTKNIELNRTYGFVLLNVHSHSSAGWGLYLRDGFNNASQIISGEYSGNGIGGVYIGTDTIQLYFSSIAEGNVKYGIYYRGHLTGLQINDAYFEANGRNRTGWDVYGDFLDYDHPAIGVSIRNTLFNSLDAKCAAHIENTVDFDFSHNIGVPPLSGDPLLVNSVVLGKGVINPHIEGNTALPVTGGSGTPIHTAPANFAENILLHSAALNALAWSYKNTGEGCAARAAVCKDGTRFYENGPAWKIPLAASSGVANLTTVTQTWAKPYAGHLLGAGVWMRTDSDTANAWLEVSDRSAAYTGSLLNQPLRQTIDANWRWISTNATTDATSGGGAVSLSVRFYATDGSSSRAVYVYAPQAWLDIAGTPQYAATTAAPVTRRIQSASSPAVPVISSQPDCKTLPNGIAGYDAAADKIWTCSNGVARPH